MEEAFVDTAQRFIDAPTLTKGTDGVEVPLAKKAADDLPRMHVNVGGVDTYKKSSAEIVDAFKGLAGTDNASKVLSGVVNQYMLRPMEQLPTEGGKPVTLGIAPKYVSDDKSSTKFVESYTFTDGEGVEHDIGKPKQYGSAQFTVDTFPDGDFRVKVDWDMFVPGFRNPDNPDNRAPLGGNDKLMKVNFTTEWRISKEQADLGKLDFSMTQPPRAAFSGKLAE